MLSQCRIRLREVAREQVARPGDHVRGTSFPASRKLQQRATKMPPRPRASTRYERISIRAKSRIELTLGNPKSTGRNSGVARERAAESGGDS